MSRCDVRAGGHGGSIKIPGMKHVALPIALAGFVMSVPAGAEEAQNFSKDQIATGAELYAVNCSPCHGARMQDPGAAFNLRKFPPDQRERFVNSVTRGKNQMPHGAISSSPNSSRRCGPMSWRENGHPRPEERLKSGSRRIKRPHASTRIASEGSSPRGRGARAKHSQLRAHP